MNKSRVEVTHDDFTAHFDSHFGRSCVGSRRDTEISTYNSLLKQIGRILLDSQEVSMKYRQILNPDDVGRDELREARMILPCIYCGVSHHSSIKLRRTGSPAETGRAYIWGEGSGVREDVSQARITRLSTKSIPILAPTWGHHCP
jgi:hypothetical protein